MFHEGDILCSKFKLKRQFNKGGFSSVWLATDLSTQEDFALKIYDNVEEMEAFQKGFKLVYRLTHSNIFTPLSYDIHNGVPFLVMSYLPCGSAASQIGKMNEDDIWRFAHDVASGLAYLHDSKNIVHQDIKPANVLIDDDGKFMITDFDISTRQSSTVRMTARQVEEMQDFNYGAGTPDYMGSERWPDPKTGYRPPVKPMQASDIWSLGASLFELMEGHVPFGETGGAHQRNLCRDNDSRTQKGDAIPKITGNYSNELKKLVRMCLAKDAWNRPKAQQIAACALRHKAPNLQQRNRKKWSYTTVCAIAAVFTCVLFLGGGGGGGRNEQHYIDSIYLSRINYATEIINLQAKSVAECDTCTFDIKKVAEAFGIYETADTMKNVSDSIRNRGEEEWASSEETINKEYGRIVGKAERFERMGATEAVKKYKDLCERIEKYVTNK